MLQLDTTTNSSADVVEAALFVSPTAASTDATIANLGPATAKQNNKVAPASSADVQTAASRLGFAVPEAHEDDYLQLLQATDRAAAALMDEPGESASVSIGCDNL
jgi:hypothetical protein